MLGNCVPLSACFVDTAKAETVADSAMWWQPPAEAVAATSCAYARSDAYFQASFKLSQHCCAFAATQTHACPPASLLPLSICGQKTSVLCLPFASRRNVLIERAFTRCALDSHSLSLSLALCHSLIFALLISRTASWQLLFNYYNFYLLRFILIERKLNLMQY